MQKADMYLVVERRICLTLGDPSTKLLRSFAYGTAQDDSVFFAGAHMGAPLRIESNVSAQPRDPVAGRQPFCRLRDISP